MILSRAVSRPKPEKPTVQVAARIDDEWVQEVDLFADEMAAAFPGSKPTRADALRAIIRKGLDVIAADRQKARGGKRG